VSILVLQIFVSLILVAGSVVLFIHTVRSRTFEHADRLALAPLEEDGNATAGQPGETTAPPSGAERETP